ncbi:MAG: substrate-binding domain-containing protein [Succinivibrio sp.]|nr:substrate-binding domain-containing protein [Succinivibrio sp.]
MNFQHFICVCLVSAGLGFSAMAQAERFDLNNFVYDLNDWYLQYLTDNLLSSAHAEQISVNLLDAKSNIATQSHQFQDNYDPKTPVAMNLVYVADAERVIEYVRRHDTPLVFYNRKPQDYVLQSYKKTWYVGVSAEESGYAQGEMIANYLKDHPEADKNNDNIYSIMLLKGQAMHYATDIRCRAILKALRDHGIEYRIIDEYNADFNFEIAQKHMSNVLKIRGTGPIELIISNCDAMALGAIKALNEYGFNLGYSKRKAIPVFGWTGLPEALEAIRNHKMQGTVAVDIKTMAKLILDLALTKYPNLDAMQQHYKFTRTEHDKVLEVEYKAVRAPDLKGKQTLFD